VRLHKNREENVLYSTTRGFLIALALVATGCSSMHPAQQAAAPPPAPVVAPTPPAPQTPPVRVRGKIAELTGTTITIVGKTGEKQVVQLTPKYAVNALVKAKLSDIKPGVFIGTTARPKGETLVADEVHIFPETMRGAGEGHYPWDTNPDATMTNASVSEITKAVKVKGSTLTLTYKGGETKVTVVPKTLIVMVTPGSKADLKKGASVFAIAMSQPDGSLKTGFLLVGRGVHPPM
jgi:hypothetical protein